MRRRASRSFRRYAALASCSALTLAVSTPPAFADCAIFDEPDFCTMVWETDDDFWIGVYDVDAGPQIVSMDGRAMLGPPESLAPATIYQFDGGLVIDHPERYIQADLVTVEIGEPAWSWENDIAQGYSGMPLSDVELMAGCTSQEFPRWHASVLSDDGVPMDLDLIAVSPVTIYGRLSATVTQDGHTMTVRRQLSFTRGDIPIEGLDFRIESDAVCEQVCEGTPYLCQAVEE